MDEITQRQIDILKVIIKEYTDSGEAVGSEILEKKYKLGVSPATIRNEMVVLAKKGYLKKSHFSSGRIPSAKGFRFYIQHLMKEKDMSTAEEVAYKNGIWDDRNETHRLLSQAAKVLAHRTGLMSLVATNAGDVYYSGIANLLDSREFLDWDLSKTLFERLDEYPYWLRIINQLERVQQDILFMLGSEDFSDPVFDNCASIFSEFNGPNTHGIIGVVGPKRMYYETVTPQVRYLTALVEKLIGEQVSAK